MLCEQVTRGAPFDIDEIEEMIDLEPLEGDAKFAAVVEDKSSELAALDRYERRALSRRKAAIRNFDAARMLAITQRPYRDVTYEIVRVVQIESIEV
jgi:hypothetical protein